MSKTLIWILGAVLLGVVGTLFYADSLIKTAMEKAIPHVTGTDASVGSVSFSLLKGEGTITDFVIYNPEGFKTDHLISVGKLSFGIDTASLLSPTIVVTHVLVDAPSVIYEFKKGGSNLDVVKRHVDSLASKKGSAAPATEEKPATDEEGGKNLIIRLFELKDASLAAGIVGKKVTMKLPDIRMEDIGAEKEEGASPTEVFGDIMKEFTASIQKAVANNPAIQGLKDAGEKAVEGLKEGAKKAADKLKGLFGQ